MKLSESLLVWYHKNRRVLPFREDPTPYHVWVSEIMLQQTRVSAVLPYYARFMDALPDIAALAACPEERLLKLWEGLGYYSRVRNLQKAAQVVVQQYGGQLPADYNALLKLPGIGPYTAGAISSIAFGLPRVAVDGNVLRVFTRLADCPDAVDLPEVKEVLAAMVSDNMPQKNPGDYNQALMELGALVCLPGAPKCGECPLAAQCKGLQSGRAAQLPARSPKRKKETVLYTGFVVWRGDEVLLQQRPVKGLLAGMWQPPLAEGKLGQKRAAAWLAKHVSGAHIVEELPPANHVFTHKIWEMQGWLCWAQEECQPALEGAVFVPAMTLREQYALPGAFNLWRPSLLAKPDALK